MYVDEILSATMVNAGQSIEFLLYLKKQTQIIPVILTIIYSITIMDTILQIVSIICFCIQSCTRHIGEKLCEWCLRADSIANLCGSLHGTKSEYKIKLSEDWRK